MFLNCFFCFFLIFLQLAYSDQILIRSFDLGGGGLKTALLTYDTNIKKMDWVEEPMQLGKCPDHQEVRQWIREVLQEKLQKNLDAEVEAGYVFGFSLAGLNKLRLLPLHTSDMSILCDLPTDQVVCIGDGAAHLIASLHFLGDNLPKGSIWNFAIGTEIGYGHADDHGVTKFGYLYKLFDENDRGVWIACGKKAKLCGGRSFDQILMKNVGDIETSFSEFTAIWKNYLDLIFPQMKEMPSAIIFTGGQIDFYQGRLIKELCKLDVRVPIFQGPKNAGLLGAAFHAITCDADQCDRLGNNPLSIALEKGLLEVAKTLIEQGACVNYPNFSGIRPLSIAAQQGNIAMVELLLDHGAEINVRDYWGRTPLFFAKEKGAKEIELLLLAQGAD